VEVCPSYEVNASSSNVTYRSEHSNHKNYRNQGKYSQQFQEINLSFKAKYDGKSAKMECGLQYQLCTLKYVLRNILLGHRVPYERI